MAKESVELNLKLDASEMIAGCEKASIAMKQLAKAVEEMQHSKIKIREVKPKKWWQFWMRS